MSHGFTRFGPPSARDRFHQQSRPAGALAMLLPTIFATLFMFTIVVTLNKAGNMSRGGKIVRLLNVDDVFPTQLDLEQNRKKEYWELTPPPPSPEAVLGAAKTVETPVLGSEGESVESRVSLTGAGLGDIPLSRIPTLSQQATGMEPDLRTLVIVSERLQEPAEARPASRVATVPTPAPQFPTVAPDTSLPVATPTP